MMGNLHNNEGFGNPNSNSNSDQSCEDEDDEFCEKCGEDIEECLCDDSESDIQCCAICGNNIKIFYLNSYKFFII